MVTLSIALPWLLGVVWLRKWWQAAQGIWLLWIGYGYIVGMLATTLLVRLVDAVGLPLYFSLIAAIQIMLIALGGWLSRGMPWHLGQVGAVWKEQSGWSKALWGLVFAWLLLRFYGFAVEISLRPLYPWDAWSTWAVKPQVWFAYRHLIPFVDPATWLADTTRTFYSLDAWHYPPTVSLIQLWMALGYGQWNESAANMPWLFCAVALGLGFYGQSRLWGADPLQSLLFTYLLLSMPLLDAHIALAGYADLWLATVYGFATLAFLQWLRTNDAHQGFLALILGLACPLIKAEGAVWLLTFIPPLLIARVPRRILLGVSGLLALLLLLWFATGGFSLSLSGLGEIHLTPSLIQIPYLGRFELGFTPNWDPFINNFLVLINWHLLWYLVLFLALLSIPKLAADKWVLLCTALVIAGLVMQFVLFFMTNARLWAELYTSINRLFLHMAPLLVFYALVLLNAMRAKAPDIRSPSVAQSV